MFGGSKFSNKRGKCDFPGTTYKQYFLPSEPNVPLLAPLTTGANKECFRSYVCYPRLRFGQFTCDLEHSLLFTPYVRNILFYNMFCKKIIFIEIIFIDISQYKFMYV